MVGGGHWWAEATGGWPCGAFQHQPEGAPTHRPRLQVLPPLKDVKIRPEVGSTLRNKLVRLMTHVDMGVKQTAAEFLFVLCKESGERPRGSWLPPQPLA